MTLTTLLIALILVGPQAAGTAPTATQTPTPTPSALESEPTGWIDLLADPSLESWTRVSLRAVGELPAGDVSAPSPWSFDAKTGVLLCEGQKAGHEMFRVDPEFADFVLHVEWRFTKLEGTPAYNAGVFVRANADGTIWHQAQTGPGGGYLFGNTLVNGTPQRVNLRDQMKENRVRPAGEWNTYEIRAVGRTLSLWVNGAVVSEFPNVEVPRGYIGLEAEGYRIEFRNLRVKRIA
jgi:hypothetical protein